MNSYQQHKANVIIRFLEKSIACSTIRVSELPKLISCMSARDWQTVCFAAGVPVADIPAKRLVLDGLRRKQIKIVR
jgi:hypothetical protein